MVYQNDYLKDKYTTPSNRHHKTTRVRAATKGKAPRRRHYTLRKWLFGGLIVTTLTLCIFWRPISDVTAVTFSSADPDLKKASLDAGLNMHGRAIFLSNSPEFATADMLASVCPHDQEVLEFGCYLPGSHKIYILEVDDNMLQSIELTAIAHEMLHAAWDRLDLDDQQTVGDELTEFYDSKVSDTLTTDAEVYRKDSTVDFVNELHSLAGSEVDESYMSDSLRNHYDQYFSNQYMSIDARTTFKQNIDTQVASLNARKKQLDTDNASLDDFKAQYLDGIKAYMQQSLYYGDITTYNKNVDAYNNNLQIYKDRTAQYNTSVDSYNADRQKLIDAYSALFSNKAVPVGDAQGK